MKPERLTKGYITKGLPRQAKEVKCHPKDDWKWLEEG